MFSSFIGKINNHKCFHQKRDEKGHEITQKYQIIIDHRRHIKGKEVMKRSFCLCQTRIMIDFGRFLLLQMFKRLLKMGGNVGVRFFLCVWVCSRHLTEGSDLKLSVKDRIEDSDQDAVSTKIQQKAPIRRSLALIKKILVQKSQQRTLNRNFWYKKSNRGRSIVRLQYEKIGKGTPRIVFHYKSVLLRKASSIDNKETAKMSKQHNTCLNTRKGGCQVDHLLDK